MNTLLAKLPPFALPFVTRSLRGGRGKRYVWLSSLIAMVTILGGLWLALGNGAAEQELRVSLDLERHQQARELEQFVLFAHDERRFAALEREADRLRRTQDSATRDRAFVDLRRMALDRTLMAAQSSDPESARLVALRDRARALSGVNEQFGWYPWQDRAEVAKLERILDMDGVPEIRRYESPLGLGDTLAILGFLSGLALAACATVFLPLLVGIQQAQEQHENTLTPLTGTGLGARGLVLGLGSGPATVVAIFAAPHLLVFAACASIAGAPLTALGLLLALSCSGLFVTVAAQLLGHLVGQKRSPGVVAIALLLVLGVAWLLGVAMADVQASAAAGLPAVMPTMGLATLLSKSFWARSSLPDLASLATLAWTGAAMVYAWLITAVLVRKIEGHEGPLLSRGPAMIGALTSIVLMLIAIPSPASSSAGNLLYFGLAGLALPLSLLLMARVPTGGDNPARMRWVPVPKLLVELSVWVGIFIAAAVALDDGAGLHPVALVWLAWCIGVAGLMAIRLVAFASNLVARLVLGFCALILVIGYVQATLWGLGKSHSLEQVFGLATLSPIAGLLQVGLTIAVPIALIHDLKTNLGSVTRAKPVQTRG